MENFNLTDFIENAIGASPVTQSRLALSIVVIATMWALRHLLIRAVETRVEDPQSRYHWRKTTAYIAFILVTAVMARVWFHGLGSISTMIGLISAGIAIALKDPLVNLVGFLFILWRQPFGVGDRIEVGGHRGDVIDQRLFAFSLMEIGNWVNADQSTGRVIHVPNGRVFVDVVANYSRGFRYIWDEIGVLVTFESDWKKAKELLAEIVEHHSEDISAEAQKQLREASRKFMIFYTKLTPIVYTSVEDSGVMLTMRYLVEPRRRRGRRQAIWEDVLNAFAECNNIDFAYPTARMYMNIREGKPGARASAGPRPLDAPPDPSEGYFDA